MWFFMLISLFGGGGSKICFGSRARVEFEVSAQLGLLHHARTFAQVPLGAKKCHDGTKPPP